MTIGTEQPSTQNNQPQNNQPDISSSDLPFYGFITSGLLGGVVLICYHLPPLAPSLFFGSAAASLVHRFLGGIKSDDSTITTGLGRLGGALASLVMTTMIFNAALTKQMMQIALKVNPSQGDLVVLNRDDGKPVEVIIDGKDGLTSNGAGARIQINQNAVDQIKRLCREGNGFCKESALNVRFTINPSLKKQFARICQNRHDLNLYPFIISGAGKDSKAARVVAISDLNCPPNTTGFSMQISQEAAQEANLHEGDEGFAGITSFIDQGEMTNSIYKEVVQKSNQKTEVQ